MVSEFNWREPESLEEVLTLLAQDPEETLLLAGGTALGLMIQQDMVPPCTLVSLRKLRHDPKLGGAWREEDGTVHIGALATLRELEQLEPLNRWAPLLVTALSQVANPRIRNMATIGGHLAYGEPHLDLPPVLVAMGASVRIRSQDRERRIALSELLQGYYSTTLDPGEMLLEVTFPEQTSRWQGVYVRYTASAADDWPMLGLALLVESEDNALKNMRLVISGICPVPTRLSAVEDMLCAERLTPSLIDEAARTATEQFEILDDLRGSAWYKQEILQVLIRRAVTHLTGVEE
jgi:carbon-monoxide dehydrogenase medium subunit